MQNLITILKENQALLGENYDKIGKTIGSSFFGRKILLSYDKKMGWGIVKLNPFQLLCRNYFWFYRATHLKHVFKRLSKEQQQTEINSKPFYSHISEAWTNKCLKLIGNTPISKAQVICFGEIHGDHANRAAVQQYINENFREGDVVLIEGAAAGEVVNHKNSQLTRNLKENCLVMGWEPSNFKALNEKGLNEHNAKYKQLTALWNNFQTTFPGNGPFTESELPLLKETLEKIGDGILELNQYYKSKDPEVATVKTFFSFWLDEVTSNHKLEDPKKLIYLAILDMVAKLEKQKENSLYNNMSKTAEQELLKAIPSRNLSLIQEISRNRLEGRRVFVIGGLAHFIVTPYENSAASVKKELTKHKFVILGRTKRMDKFADLNKDIFQSIK